MFGEKMFWNYLEWSPGPSFWKFLELPPELRMKIVDFMNPEDRCRFAGASKLSRKEARSSKNYIYGLSLKCFRAEARIEVCHNEYGPMEKKRYDYYLRFYAQKRNYISCFDRDDEEVWKSPLDRKTDAVHHAIDTFKKMLQDHQNSIKLVSCDQEYYEFDLGVRNLNSLEELTIYSNGDYRPLLSITRRNLKVLTVLPVNEDGLHYPSEEIYHVQNYLNMPYLELSVEQFSRLPAPRIYINIGNLTEQDIVNVVKFWQNDTTRKKMESYKWEKYARNFDPFRVFQLLGKFTNNMVDKIQLEHNIFRRKFATLRFDYNYYLEFYENNDSRPI